MSHRKPRAASVPVPTRASFFASLFASTLASTRKPIGAATLLTLTAIGFLSACGDAPADLILTNGRVYSLAWPNPAPDGTPAAGAPVDGAGNWHPVASAVVIREGRIVFMGSDEDARTYAGPMTRVEDVGGATVLPGFVDSHTHITELGGRVVQVDLVGVDTEEEAVRRAAARAAELPAGSWVIGSGWDEGAWANRYPTWDLLSEAVPDHPVYLRGLHGFAGWGNRMAFERAGIDRDTEAPVGGEIRRDEEGEPTGLLLNRAVTLLDEAVPTPEPAVLQEQVLAGLREMARSGYVGVHYAGVSAESMDALEVLAAEDRLPIRVYAMLSGRDTTLLSRWLERGVQDDPESMLRVRSVKAYYDGALGSRGARLLADYSDRPGHRGVSGEGYGFDRDWIARMMLAGFQVGIHAIGDAGNRETLDFIESVVERDPAGTGARHRIEHAQVVHPDDFARFLDLGVIASMEPPHAVEDKTWAEERLGPERLKGAYAWRTMRTTGIPLVFNSDLPGSDWSPFYGLHAAMTRQDKERQPEGGWTPEERVTPEEAVRAYSTWAAYAAFVEDRTGALAPGWWADLTVIDVDPFTAEPADLLRGQVVLTVVNGRVVDTEGG